MPWPTLLSTAIGRARRQPGDVTDADPDVASAHPLAEGLAIGDTLRSRGSP